MNEDNRKFSLTLEAGPGPIYDKHKTWTMLEALEVAVRASATQYESMAIAETVSVTHGKGDTQDPRCARRGQWAS